MMIPAALSWGFGGIFIVGSPFGLTRIWSDFRIPPDAAWGERLLVLAWTTTPIVMLASGLLNLRAGHHWRKANWRRALLFNLVAHGLLLGIETLENAVFPIMRRL